MIKGGPTSITDGLIFYVDALDQKCIRNKGGCMGYTGSVQLLNNVLDPNNVISASFDVRIGGMDFYTAVAITYPQGSYGGDLVNRSGITTGYNVKSGGLLYGGDGRALHMWAYDNKNNAWISDSYFNGWENSGHAYDNYSGVGEPTIGNALAQFVTDYNTINSIFPDVTFIVAGAHAAEIYNDATRTIILDLGAPSASFASTKLTDGSRAEWILVGKPGLGPDNYFAFAYENYVINPTEVAHLSFGLPTYGRSSNHLIFDGNGYASTASPVLPTSSYSPLTFEAWAMLDATNNGWQTVIGTNGSYRQIGFNNANFYYGGNAGSGNNLLSGGSVSANIWYHICMTYDGVGTTAIAYLDGVQSATGDIGTNGVDNGITALSSYTGTGANESLIGKIAVAKIYNRALSATEILNNYNSQKSRFGK